MEQAIRKAIEGGYTYICGKRGTFEHIGDGMECEFSGVNSAWTVWTRKDNGSSLCISHEETVLLPLFWQALGKAEGWDKTVCFHCGAIITYGEDTVSTNIHCDHKNIKDLQEKWRSLWHRFIDHLADGKDAEEFFKELLP